MATTERRGLRVRGRIPAAGPATAARPAAKRDTDGARKGRWPRRRREVEAAATDGRRAGAAARGIASAAMVLCVRACFALAFACFRLRSRVSAAVAAPYVCEPADNVSRGAALADRFPSHVLDCRLVPPFLLLVVSLLISFPL